MADDNTTRFFRRSQRCIFDFFRHVKDFILANSLGKPAIVCMGAVISCSASFRQCGKLCIEGFEKQKAGATDASVAPAFYSRPHPSTAGGLPFCPLLLEPGIMF
ncbi:hypothetical protein [Solibaculum intestinale]|uniref:Uncharacterized protein n=1 Tax=Solibaculum intestinale TaxID=3133165 RepID=A0ABV1E0D9_9FIRM